MDKVTTKVTHKPEPASSLVLLLVVLVLLAPIAVNAYKKVKSQTNLTLLSSPKPTASALPLTAKAYTEKKLAVGESLELKDRTVTVTKIERSWDKGEEVLLPGTTAEHKNYYEIALVTVTVKNKLEKDYILANDNVPQPQDQCRHNAAGLLSSGFVMSKLETEGVYGITGKKAIPNALGSVPVPPGGSITGNIAVYLNSASSSQESFIAYGYGEACPLFDRPVWNTYSQWTIVPAALDPDSTDLAIKVNNKSSQPGHYGPIETFGKNSSDKLYLTISVTIKNNASSDRSLGSLESNFSFVDSDGIARTLENANVYGIKDLIKTQRLAPGESVTGNLIFSQPQSLSGKLIYKLPSWSDEKKLVLDI